MRAFRLTQWGEPTRIVETPVPQPKGGQLLVRVAANGLCHSDVMISHMPKAFGEALGWQVPFTLGHEIAGWVEQVGDGVDATLVGQAVALVAPASCGMCPSCQAGHENRCRHGDVGRGFGRDGGLAPFVIADSQRQVVPIGDLDPVAAAPLTDAGATALHGVRKGLDLVGGDAQEAVVIGAGGLGVFALQFVGALSSAHIVAIDINERRRAAARRAGAHEVIAGVDDQTAAIVHEITGGDGAELVLDFVGTDATIACGLAVTARGGAYGLIGAAGGTLRKPWFGALPRDACVFTFQGSDIRDLVSALDLAAQGRIVSRIERFAFDDVTNAYEALEHGELEGRAVVIPDALRH